jgi:hypothetical protein
MNTLIGSTASQSSGQVRILWPHVEALPLMSLSLMLRSKTVRVIKKADFGGIEPHSASPPIPHRRQSEYRCTPEV